MTIPLRKRIRRGVRSVVLVGLLRARLPDSARPGASHRRLGRRARLPPPRQDPAAGARPPGAGLPGEDARPSGRPSPARCSSTWGARPWRSPPSAPTTTGSTSYVEMRERRACPGGSCARGKGIVFVTGHLGNWELIARRDRPRRRPQSRPSPSAATTPGSMALIEEWRLSGQVTTLWREDAVDRSRHHQGPQGRRWTRHSWWIRTPTSRGYSSRSSDGWPTAPGPRPTWPCASAHPSWSGPATGGAPTPGDGLELEFTEIPYDPNAARPRGGGHPDHRRLPGGAGGRHPEVPVRLGLDARAVEDAALPPAGPVRGFPRRGGPGHVTCRTVSR